MIARAYKGSQTLVMAGGVLIWFSLCYLCVLCVSVVAFPEKQLTTEAQRTQRFHREEFKRWSRNDHH